MRKYYVFEVANGDSKIAGVSVGTFDTEKDAVASFHQRLSTAMKSDLYESDMVMVIDDNGAVLKVEKYNAPQPEPEEETNMDDILA
jgi:hypothetical protein